MASEFTWSPLEETVKCCNCFGTYEDHEVIQRSNILGKRQYICVSCMEEMEVPSAEETETVEAAA